MTSANPAATARRATSSAPTFLGSTVGKKVVMAATGIILFGFVLAHALGNLQLYQGREAINAYGAFLHGFIHGAGLWVFRSVLFVAVVGHVWAAASLTMANNAARPVGYRMWKAQASTYASRTMRVSGVIILFFILFHLAHFTTGQAHPSFVPGDVYRNVVIGFQNPVAAGFYIVANILLGTHLRHGVWSMLQTLGLNHPRYNGLRKSAATAFALAVTLINVSFPVAVLAGLVR